ncbi:hypothetical protein GCM10009657_01260 [Oryzihumus leptocrescens]
MDLEGVTGAEGRDVVAEARLVDGVELVHDQFAFPPVPQVTERVRCWSRGIARPSVISYGCSREPWIAALPLWQGRESVQDARSQSATADGPD